MKTKRSWLLALPLALVLAGGAAWFAYGPRSGAGAAQTPKAQAESYEFATISRSSIESVVTASGTLSPVAEVSVLPQMSGRALKVYATYNQRVRKGQVLVELDTTMLRLTEREKAAAVSKAAASYELQATTVQNSAVLAEKGLISAFDYASAKSALASCAAELEAAQAALDSVRTQLRSYATVTSPISGIVLERNVNEGETVVEGSSSNSTSLFTIAEDLSRMEIEAEVDELDIGSIKPGQEVRFSVEALPGVECSGSVREVRLVPKSSDNVVTYTVIVDAPNVDGRLLPGMTAEVSFIKEKREDVLVVPSAALRFQPAGLGEDEIAKAVYLAGLGELSAAEKAEAAAMYDAERKAAAEKSTSAKPSGLSGLMGGGGPGMGGPGMGGPGMGSRSGSSRSGGSPAASAQAAATATAAKKSLWYLDDSGALAVVMVEVGASDSLNTEVGGAEGLEGMEIILKAKVN